MSQIILRQIIREMLLNEAPETLDIPTPNKTIQGDSIVDTAFSAWDAAKKLAAVGLIRRGAQRLGKSESIKKLRDLIPKKRYAAGAAGVGAAIWAIMSSNDKNKDDAIDGTENNSEASDAILEEIQEKLKIDDNKIKFISKEAVLAAIANKSYKDIINKEITRFENKTTTYDLTISEYYNSPNFSINITDEMKASDGVIHLLAVDEVSNEICGRIIGAFAELYKDDRGNEVYKFAQGAIKRIDDLSIMDSVRKLKDELENQ